MRRTIIIGVATILMVFGAFFAWYSLVIRVRQTELVTETDGWKSLTEAYSWEDGYAIVIPPYDHYNFSYYVEPDEKKDFIFEFLADGRIRHEITTESYWNDWLAGGKQGWMGGSDVSDHEEIGFGQDTGRIWVFGFQNDNSYTVKVNYQLNKYWYEPYWLGVYGGITMIAIGAIFGVTAFDVFRKKARNQATGGKDEQKRITPM